MTAPGEAGAPAPTMTSPIAYFNGQFLPAERISISPLDRGFIFGDGVYEVIPVYEGVPLRAREHFERLQRSMDEIRLDNPHNVDEWIAIVAKLLEHHPGNQSVYIHVTRGVPPKRDHVIPKGLAPTVMMMAFPLVSPSKEQVERGVACVTARDFRWERGDIKSTSLLGNVLARQISADRDSLETIMFRDGFLTEASGSNVWVVHEGALLGPPKSEHVLEGIRYELIRELCEECGIAFNLRPLPEGEVIAADEILLSSATKEVLPVTTLDGEGVGHGALRGKPGPVYAKLYEAYQRAKVEQSI